MSNHKLIANAITAVLTLGIAGTAMSAEPTAAEIMAGDIPGMEKCYGVTKAGMNDCGTATHNCSGEAKVDGDKTAWVRVPTGLCNRLVGGATKTPVKS